MTMYGANADELDRVAKAMLTAADDLENDTGYLSRLIHSVPWVGGIAKVFMQTWEANHVRRLQRSVQFLRLTAEGLTKNAAQQREASNDAGHAVGGSSTIRPRPDRPRGSGDLLHELERTYRELAELLRPRDLARALIRSMESFEADRMVRAFAALAAIGAERGIRAPGPGIPPRWQPLTLAPWDPLELSRLEVAAQVLHRPPLNTYPMLRSEVAVPLKIVPGIPMVVSGPLILGYHTDYDSCWIPTSRR